MWHQCKELYNSKTSEPFVLVWPAPNFAPKLLNTFVNKLLSMVDKIVCNRLWDFGGYFTAALRNNAISYISFYCLFCCLTFSFETSAS